MQNVVYSTTYLHERGCVSLARDAVEGARGRMVVGGVREEGGGGGEGGRREEGGRLGANGEGERGRVGGGTIVVISIYLLKEEKQGLGFFFSERFSLAAYRWMYMIQRKHDK